MGERASMTWFDAHLDLAYLAELGRDLECSPSECGGPLLPAAVTFSSLAEGPVGACLATIFTEPGGERASVSYPAGDAEAAHAAGGRQVQRYHAWARAGRIRLGGFGAVKETWGPEGAQRVGILLEGADPIRTPAELERWVRWGVVAVGMAWWKPSRYAGGNRSDLGLSDLGRELVRAMDALGVVHDVSHLSDRALDDLLRLTARPVIASHSNCRALMDGKDQRHLTDAAIREIARRGGVIGLNLFSKFLREGLEDGQRATLDDAVRHVERICELAGHRRAVGLGSDMDGGFTAAALPEGIDGPRDLGKLLSALRGRGWTDTDLDGFRWGNWARFLF